MAYGIATSSGTASATGPLVSTPRAMASQASGGHLPPYLPVAPFVGVEERIPTEMDGQGDRGEESPDRKEPAQSDGEDNRWRAGALDRDRGEPHGPPPPTPPCMRVRTRRFGG